MFLIPTRYSVDMNKLIFKNYMEMQKSRIVNTILKKKKLEGLTLPSFKTYSKTIIIKTVWYWQKNK